MTPPTLPQLEAIAAQLVNDVSDDPNGRLALREKFYHRYGDGSAGRDGLGNSELAFLRWEIERGVLNPLNDKDTPGSPWWRKVNSRFIYYSELAGLLEEKNPSLLHTNPIVGHWRQYIKDPRPKTWYRAHNATIVSGYIEADKEASEESLFERLFMNSVLYRVLFAQAMVEGVAFGGLGKVLANPRLPSVDVLVHIPQFYFKDYPLTPKDINFILHKTHNLGEDAVDILDDGFILPHITQLYTEASTWLGTPELKSFLKNNVPVYNNLTVLQGRQLIHRNFFAQAIYLVIHWLSGVFSFKNQSKK